MSIIPLFQAEFLTFTLILILLIKKLIENLVKDFPLSNINQVWVSDITYIKTKYDGTVYLASIMGLYSRKIIAWEVSSSMKKELVMYGL